MPTPVEQLTVEEFDALIALTHADLTWRSPTEQQVVWGAIDNLLDQRNQITKGTR